MKQQQVRRDSEVIVVSQRRRLSIPLIVVVAVFILGMAGALAAQPTASGKVTAVIFFAILIGLCVGLWLLLNRQRDRIEVTRDSISRRRWNGRVELMLSRQQGAVPRGGRLDLASGAR
jgi:hypothetical protein